jgi:hypothetical protein
MKIIKALAILISVGSLLTLPVNARQILEGDYGKGPVDGGVTVKGKKYRTSEEGITSKCQSTSDSLVNYVKQTSGLLSLNRLNIHTGTKLWSNPPQGEMFVLDIGGNQKTQWFSDTKTMQNITTKLVKSCPSVIGSIVSTEGDYLSIYGLVDGRVKKFTCPKSKSAPFRWGYYSGGCY